MAKIITWMPFYVSDYLRDTAHLTLMQHGAYSMLLNHTWTLGPLANDEELLARLCRVDVRTWRKLAPTVLAFFSVVDGKLIQKRMEAERAKAVGIIDKRTIYGKAGAEARWGKQDSETGGISHPKPMAKAIAKAMPPPLANGWQTHWQNDAPSQSQKKVSKKQPALFNLAGVTKCPDTGRDTVNGYYLDAALEVTLEAARLDPSSKRDLKPLVEWLQADIPPPTIRAAIERISMRSGYVPPASLRYFDSAVREQPREMAA
jgi:uncharacterized protein YdaU (DUF1376 family)